MRRLDNQILIRTDYETKTFFQGYCARTNITLHDLMLDLKEKIEGDRYGYKC